MYLNNDDCFLSGKTEELVYDAVLICTGHHADIHVPTFPGQEK